jgi:hypothetical protein
MTQAERNRAILLKYIPEPAADIIVDWIYKYNFKLKVKRPRASKEGDYMAPHSGRNHVITINKDLNKYAFLITLIHEVAHLVTWEKYKGRVSPHGAEWKIEYSRLLGHFLSLNNSLAETSEVLFPAEIATALRIHAERPSAASCSDLNLARVLKKFDPQSDKLLLESIPAGASFKIASSRSRHSKEVFVKGPKRRTRFECFHPGSKRRYYVPSLCEVILV